MDIDVENGVIETGSKNVDEVFEVIIKSLVNNNTIIFKSQQMGEQDLTETDKTAIASELFHKNKLNFLLKFGQYLTAEELKEFEQFTKEEMEPLLFQDIDILLKQFQEQTSKEKQLGKNKRYLALQQLIEDNSYFSEVEMMKRNPLLYEQLVGQYLSEEEKKERDRYILSENVTLTKILLEGIDRQEAEQSKFEQSKEENDQTDEESISSDEDMPDVNRTPWGEYDEVKTKPRTRKKKLPIITASERLLLKEEFVTTMYRSFLDGKDTEFFDYSAVDNNVSYSDTINVERDAEDKYFETEDTENDETSTETMVQTNDSSEDELDIYMRALNQHTAVCDLAKNIHDNL